MPRSPADTSARSRGRQAAAVRESLRELSIQLALLNRQVGGHVELRDGDIACLDLISRLGPLSPSTLASRAGLHPATLTGILDRLERGRWIARDRDSSDRRSVQVRVLPDRITELLSWYAPMNSALERIFAGYSDAQLGLLAEFLRRVTEAGQNATDELSDAD